MRQLRAAGFDAPIVTREIARWRLLDRLDPDLSYFYVISYGSKYGDDPDAAVNGFFKRFEAKYGKKADVSYGLRGYAAVQAWAEAANEDRRLLDGAKVAAVLDTFNKQPLIIGPTTYTNKLHIQTTRPMAILAATNGKFACVGRFTVESFPPLQ